ncbi:MAG: hypothetical protein MJ252_23905 [archaeon]|nr:hypothetical protein [archaeon]
MGIMPLKFNSPEDKSAFRYLCERHYLEAGRPFGFYKNFRGKFKLEYDPEKEFFFDRKGAWDYYEFDEEERKKMDSQPEFHFGYLIDRTEEEKSTDSTDPDNEKVIKARFTFACCRQCAEEALFSCAPNRTLAKYRYLLK